MEEKHITTLKRFPPVEKFKNKPQKWSIVKLTDDFLEEYAISDNRKVYGPDDNVTLEVEDDWSFIFVKYKNYALVYGESPLHYSNWVISNGKSSFEKAMKKFEEIIKTNPRT